MTKKIIETENSLNHVWSLLCEKTSIDQKSNILSIFNLIEEITLSDLHRGDKKVEAKDLKETSPFVLPKEMQYISMWRRGTLAGQGQIEQEMKIEWVSPLGKTLAMSQTPITLESGKRNLRFIFSFDKLALTVLGTYVLRLSTKEKGEGSPRVITETPVDIKLI
jgi:hypothetical protein